MKHVHVKLRVIWALIGLGTVASLCVLLSGCWLLNVAPVASFTASAISGTVPLTVNVSAILSSDEDGIIVKFEWDFGDGSSGSGESASHTYTTAGTFTIVLRVTDDNGATDRASKTITVNEADEADGAAGGPSATFTATPLVGPAPLTVTFNASASFYAGFAITYYSWDFGDGVTGTGMTTTHTYAPLVTTTYNVVLRIIASDNTEDTATKAITVTVVPATSPSTAPTASFTAAPTTGLVPDTKTFDPAASTAAAGRTLSTWAWSYGDGSYHSTNTNQTVSHTYYTAQASQNFTVTLTVIDDVGSTDSYSRTVTSEDWQPIAGFEMVQTPSATWAVADITINGVGDNVQTVSFRSQDPNNWTVPPLPKAAGTKPANFETAPYSAGDKNLSYDPEGQSLGNGWGITQYVWSFNGGTPVGVVPPIAANANGGCDEFQVTFQLGVTDNSRTFDVQLTVVDAQGAQASLTRKVTLNRFP